MRWEHHPTSPLKRQAKNKPGDPTSTLKTEIIGSSCVIYCEKIWKSEYGWKFENSGQILGSNELKKGTEKI